MIACSWKENWGVECPGCGAQRSFLQLVHGDILKAMEQFPAIVPLLGVFIAVFVLLLPVSVRTKKIAAKLLPLCFLFTAAIMFQTWVFRFFLLQESFAWVAGGFFYLLILFVGIKITFTNKLKIL